MVEHLQRQRLDLGLVGARVLLESLHHLGLVQPLGELLFPILLIFSDERKMLIWLALAGELSDVCFDARMLLVYCRESDMARENAQT